MKASKCPTDELSLMNRAIVNPNDFYNNDDKYIDLSTGPGQHFIFAIERSPEGKKTQNRFSRRTFLSWFILVLVQSGSVGFSLLQRKWATLSINQVKRY